MIFLLMMQKFWMMIEKTVNFFNLDKESVPKKGANYFIYTITVNSNDRSNKIITSDGPAPKALKPLIKYIKKALL